MTYSEQHIPVHQNGQAPGKLPPFDEECERRAIGGLLYNCKFLDTNPINSKCFFIDKYQWICEALIQVYNSGDFIDNEGGLLPAIADRLLSQSSVDKKNGQKSTRLDDIGGENQLLELVSSVLNISETPYYLDKVIKFSNQRKLIHLADQIARIGFDETIDNPDDLVEGHIKHYQVSQIKPKKKKQLENNVTRAPPLLKYARLTDEQIQEAKTAGKWLDDYVKFASEASPLTPKAFHIAAALFTGGLAIARRLHLAVSIEENWIKPNLYMLFVGRSTLPRKSTALNVARGLLNKADMLHFLLADRQTPEALTLDLTTDIPPKFDTWDIEKHTAWLRERAIAAQRGWLLDEASHLLESFDRTYSSGLLPIVLDLYEGTNIGASRNTIMRGREKVKDAYLNIFGATTFGAMARHVNKEEHWENGLFARIALISSDETGEWQFWPEPMEYPQDLINRLRFVAYELLPMPKAEIIKEQIGEREVDVVNISPSLESHSVQITAGAWHQWEVYSKAIGHDILLQKAALEKFDASHGRLSTMLIKVAMILATFDTEKLPVIVEEKHVFRAQIIVEEWRENLHRVLLKAEKASDNGMIERIKIALAENGQEWTKRRELLRKLNKTWKDISETIANLVESEEVESVPTSGRGKPSEQYRLSI